MSKKKWIARIGTAAVLLIVAAVMLVIGRGHTVYFDNKTIEVNGQTYEAFHKVEVFVKGEKVAKLGKRDRGMAETMGQKFEMTLEVTEEKGKDPDTYGVTLNLPYNMDGILINIPAMLNGLTEDDFLSELEIALPEETEESQEGEEGDLMEGLPGDI